MDRDVVRLMLSSLRHSVEAARSSAPKDQWKQSILKLESLRVDFNSSRFFALRQGALQERFGDLREGLGLLLNDHNFVDYIDNQRFRVAAGPRTRALFPPEFLEEGLNIETAMRRLIAYLEEGSEPISAIQPQLALGRLQEIVPEQKIAPAKFDIREGKVVLVDQPAVIDPDDAGNVRSARDALVARGEKILAELSRTNCDRRLVDTILELQQGLQADKNIIELGLLNVGCSAVCETAKDELPDAVRGMIEGHTASVAMFVAQFPEWQRFSEKAATVALDQSDIAVIATAAVRVAQNLEQRSEIADPEVPKTIRFLATLIRDPMSSKRAAFAVLRTLENLVAKILSYSATLIDKTVTKTIDGLSSAASKAIIISLMTLAISSVTDLGPVTTKIAESSWMKTAVEIVKKQVEGAS